MLSYPLQKCLMKWKPIAVSSFHARGLLERRLEVAYCLGCSTTLRTDFLWLVRVALVFPAIKSHSLMVESWLPAKNEMASKCDLEEQQQSTFVHTETPELPVMICGSAAWHLTVATVLVWPVSVCALAFDLMSHTCADRRKKTNLVTFTWKQRRTSLKCDLTLAVASLLHVTSTSIVGCKSRSYTALRWPW